MSADDLDMELLAGCDLDRAGQSLYFAARRFCLLQEQGFIQEASQICPHDPAFIRIGSAAHELVEAGRRFGEAHERWEKYLPPEDGQDELACDE